jgi:LacI family transcriptional regulator
VTEPVPTTQIISAIAGVSKSTVSRALNGDVRISLKTRKRIAAIAEKLGYTPNAMARSLVTRRSGVIGYVIGQTENLFYQEQVERISRVASESGVHLMLFQVPLGGDLARQVPSMLQYRLDGCIVIASVPMSSASVATCARYRMPVVLLNRLATGTSASSVFCANVDGGRRVAEFLVAGGHRRIAFIAGREDSTISHDREAGFVAGLAAAGLTIGARRTGHFTFEGAFAAAHELLDLPAAQRPDAIFAASDVMAFAVIDAMREAGLRAPADISVVGFDGARAGAWPAYDLTTVAQPIEAMFARAVDLVNRRDASGLSPPEAIYIQPEFRLRKSARIPAGWPASGKAANANSFTAPMLERA